MTDEPQAIPEVQKLVALLAQGPGARIPCGFIVASDVWAALGDHPEVVKTEEDGDRRRVAETGGTPIVCDPELPDGQVDVAITPQGFRDRMAQIKARAADV